MMMFIIDVCFIFPCFYCLFWIRQIYTKFTSLFSVHFVGSLLHFLENPRNKVISFRKGIINNSSLLPFPLPLSSSLLTSRWDVNHY